LDSTAAEASPVRPESTDSQLEGLVDRLRQLPEVREDSVRIAREQIAGGDLTTRSAAERLASTLRQAFFPHHP
jgi:hypothetical protein